MSGRSIHIFERENNQQQVHKLSEGGMIQEIRSAGSLFHGVML